MIKIHVAEMTNMTMILLTVVDMELDKVQLIKSFKNKIIDTYVYIVTYLVLNLVSLLDILVRNVVEVYLSIQQGAVMWILVSDRTKVRAACGVL